MLSRIKTLYLILNLKSLCLVTLAMASMYACQRFGLVADFPLAVVLTAVVFPIVFSIGAAYQRRETALAQYASMKAHGHAIYLAARDWVEEPTEQPVKAAREALTHVFTATRDLLIAPSEELTQREQEVYRHFGELSRFVRMHLRGKNLAGGEISRCNQYISKMLTAFETIKHIYQYRTPVSLRTFSDFFVVLLPVLYGPYFAHLAQDYPAALAFVPPLLFTLVLVTLDNIQDHLENPFDQIGEDDIELNVERFLERLYL